MGNDVTSSSSTAVIEIDANMRVISAPHIEASTTLKLNNAMSIMPLPFGSSGKLSDEEHAEDHGLNPDKFGAI